MYFFELSGVLFTLLESPTISFGLRMMDDLWSRAWVGITFHLKVFTDSTFKVLGCTTFHVPQSFLFNCSLLSNCLLIFYHFMRHNR